MKALRLFVLWAASCCSLLRSYRGVNRINLCCGFQQIPGYTGIDTSLRSDIVLDLSRFNLPFADSSLDSVVCMSAINYFTYDRAAELIKDVYRVLKKGGIARFGVQDLEYLAKLYIARDREFFFQKLPNGSERFAGRTFGDKFVAWFYGYAAGAFPCRYFFDYESLALLFADAGFSCVEKRTYRESRLDQIDLIDNRPEQMFYLEVVK